MKSYSLANIVDLTAYAKADAPKYSNQTNQIGTIKKGALIGVIHSWIIVNNEIWLMFNGNVVLKPFYVPFKYIDTDSLKAQGLKDLDTIEREKKMQNMSSIQRLFYENKYTLGAFVLLLVAIPAIIKKL